jgi:hypothetical protein
MSDDLTFGVRLDGESSTMVRAATDATAAMVDLKTATEQYTTANGELTSSLAEATKSFEVDQARSNQMAAAMMATEDAIKDKAWALANGYKDVGGQMVKTAEEVAGGMDTTAFATRRAMQEMVVLGREVGRGNFSRLPGTLSIIAQGLGPVGWAVAGVTAAVAAGVYAWYEWGDAAGKAAEKAQSDLAAAEASAKKSIHLNNVEQIAEDLKKIQSLEMDNAYIGSQIDKLQATERTASNNRKLADHIMYLSQERAANREHIENLKKDQAERADRIKPDKPENDGSAKLLADAQRLDAQLLEVDKDAFTKRIDQWTAMQAALEAKGLYSGQVQLDHEAALTVMTNAEYDKRTAYEAAQDAKKKAAADQHMATALDSEKNYFAKIQAMVDDASLSVGGKEKLRYDRELIALNAEHDKTAKAVKDDHAKALAEEDAYQIALGNLKRLYALQSFKEDATVHEMALAFTEGNQQEEVASTFGYLEKLSSLGAAHHRGMFELNKISSMAIAAINTAKGISGVLAEFPGPVGWGMAAAQLALGIAQEMAIKETSFGGGSASAGGGGIPSMATSPGVPVTNYPASTAGTTAPPPAPTTVNVYVTGNLLSSDYIQNNIIPEIQSAVNNSDVLLIDPRSRQAQVLAAV